MLNPETASVSFPPHFLRNAMPTYDYVCESCGHKWELFQSIKAEAVRTCPECGKKKAKRMIGPGAGIIFKGSGFYQTDYRSSAYKKAAEADQKSQNGGDSKKSESSTKSESSSDSKAGSAKSDSKSSESKD
jgi:putative FmdB family regulatory protein